MIYCNIHKNYWPCAQCDTGIVRDGITNCAREAARTVMPLLDPASFAERFGRHLDSCATVMQFRSPVRSEIPACTCGLDAAIAQAKAATGSVEEASKAAARALWGTKHQPQSIQDEADTILAALAPHWPQGSAPKHGITSKAEWDRAVEEERCCCERNHCDQHQWWCPRIIAQKLKQGSAGDALAIAEEWLGGGKSWGEYGSAREQAIHKLSALIARHVAPKQQVAAEARDKALEEVLQDIGVVVDENDECDRGYNIAMRKMYAKIRALRSEAAGEGS